MWNEKNSTTHSVVELCKYSLQYGCLVLEAICKAKICFAKCGFASMRQAMHNFTLNIKARKRIKRDSRILRRRFVEKRLKINLYGNHLSDENFLQVLSEGSLCWMKIRPIRLMSKDFQRMVVKCERTCHFWPRKTLNSTLMFNLVYAIQNFTFQVGFCWKNNATWRIEFGKESIRKWFSTC